MKNSIYRPLVPKLVSCFDRCNMDSWIFEIRMKVETEPLNKGFPEYNQNVKS